MAEDKEKKEESKARIKRVVESEGVKYEIYIPRENAEANILINLDEDSFFKMIEAVGSFGEKE